MADRRSGNRFRNRCAVSSHSKTTGAQRNAKAKETETFPEHVTLTQVSLGALMTARRLGTRNRFDRKIADFVLCTRGFKVVAVIELDDASHRTKREKDKARDAMLQSAGYKTLRFANVPDTADLKAAVTALATTAPSTSQRATQA